MARNSVTIPPRIIAGLRRQAVATAPAECCGALIGVVRGTVIDVRTLIPVENAATSATHYHIDAETVLRLERQAACAGLHVVGFYHSHPEHAAEPSATDLELACPGYVHLIVQTDTGSVRGWRLRDDRSGFRELNVAAFEGAA
jgi:proteasome lid subunit RPN8/RPN11